MDHTLQTRLRSLFPQTHPSGSEQRSSCTYTSALMLNMMRPTLVLAIARKPTESREVPETRRRLTSTRWAEPHLYALPCEIVSKMQWLIN